MAQLLGYAVKRLLGILCPTELTSTVGLFLMQEHHCQAASVAGHPAQKASEQLLTTMQLRLAADRGMIASHTCTILLSSTRSCPLPSPQTLI